MKLNFWLIRFGFLIIFGLLGGNIYSIQIHDGALYAQKADALEEKKIAPIPHRGLIYFTDKNKNAIQAVMNKEYPTIFAVPEKIDDVAEAVNVLSPLVNIETEKLRVMLSKSNDEYELLVEKATAEQVNAVRAAALAGIHVRPVTYRYYPLGSMAAHLLGFISPSQDGTVQGRYGLELEMEKELRGSSQQTGKSINLSIDRNIQAEAEATLGSLIKTWNADGGSVIVQNPKTGKIMAMASAPSFDPNVYNKYDLSRYQNAAVEKLYEPGSVFKVLTIAAALDAGAVTPQTTYTDTGSMTLNTYTIRNWDHKANGVQTMTNVIEKSINTGSIFAERKLGHKKFFEYVKNFGFGEVTGVSLPGEVRGSIKTIDGAREDVNYATASFGQGVSVTPLQMITAFSVIANGGVLMKPSILEQEKPEVVRRVVSEEAARQMREMMVSAVDKNVLAHIPQYQVAGKTGTAFIPDFKKGGYTENVINTYIGFAPAHDAPFVVLIKLDNPAGAPLAGQTVVPAFKHMTEFLLNYYEIAPDRAIQ